MSQIILLDTGPLGLVSNPKWSTDSEECNEWLEERLSKKIKVFVPEIADYELRRELIRAGKIKGIANTRSSSLRTTPNILKCSWMLAIGATLRDPLFHSMPTSPQHILVVHVAGLTQTTLALPALRSLRNHLPQSRITVASSSTAADLLRLAGCADEILPVARFRGGEFLNPRKFYRATKSLSLLRREYFDLAIEFKTGAEAGVVLQFAHPRERLSRRRNVGAGIEAALDRLSQAISNAGAARRHAAHEYLKKLEPLGVRPVEAEPRIATARESNERIERLLRKHNLESGELLVGVHPGAGYGKPRWPIERFASIAARMIHNFNARVLVFAGPNERGLAKRLTAMLPARRAIAIQSPKIADFVSAAARLSLFVGNHSGPAHVAAAAGAPVVVVSTFVQPSPQDLLGARVEHIRAPHVTLVSEEDVYEAACRLLKTNRAELLRSR